MASPRRSQKRKVKKNIPAGIAHVQATFDPLPHLPTRLERDHILLGHINLFAGPRIASHAGGASLDRERAEADQRHRTAIRQRARDGIERCVDGLRCISPRQTGRGCYCFYQFTLVHNSPLQIDC